MDKIYVLFPGTLIIFLLDALYEVHGFETTRTCKPMSLSLGPCFFLGILCEKC